MPTLAPAVAATAAAAVAVAVAAPKAVQEASWSASKRMKPFCRGGEQEGQEGGSEAQLGQAPIAHPLHPRLQALSDLAWSFNNRNKQTGTAHLVGVQAAEAEGRKGLPLLKLQHWVIHKRAHLRLTRVAISAGNTANRESASATLEWS